MKANKVVASALAIPLTIGTVTCNGATPNIEPGKTIENPCQRYTENKADSWLFIHRFARDSFRPERREYMDIKIPAVGPGYVYSADIGVNPDPHDLHKAFLQQWVAPDPSFPDTNIHYKFSWSLRDGRKISYWIDTRFPGEHNQQSKKYSNAVYKCYLMQSEVPFKHEDLLDVTVYLKG